MWHIFGLKDLVSGPHRCREGQEQMHLSLNVKCLSKGEDVDSGGLEALQDLSIGARRLKVKRNSGQLLCLPCFKPRIKIFQIIGFYGHFWVLWASFDKNKKSKTEFANCPSLKSCNI